MATPIISTTTGSSEPGSAEVFVSGYFYAVDLGTDLTPRHHRVGIDGKCTCKLGRACPAVAQVRAYLAEGGKRVKRPPYGFYPVAPVKCPVCGADVYVDLSLSSPNRGAGWGCAVGGKSHYWLHRAHINIHRARLARVGKVV